MNVGPSQIHGGSFLLHYLCFPLLVHSPTSFCHSRTCVFVSFSSITFRALEIFLPLSLGFYFLIQCSCTGASLCFLMSQTLAKQLVLRKFPGLFKKFNSMVQKNRHNLFWYMLFLRLTPLVPNWFVNLGSPLVGIPYKYFLGASMIGLMPMNFILMKTGQTLQEI